MTQTTEIPELRVLHRFLFPERYGRDAMDAHPHVDADDTEDGDVFYEWDSETIDELAELLESLMRNAEMTVPEAIDDWRQATWRSS